MLALSAAISSAFLLSACADLGALSSASMFVNEVEWTSPPPELQKSYLEGDGEIVILFPSGEFAYLSVTLFRDKASGSVAVCGGCGHSLRKGTWRETDANTFLEQSHWVYRNVPPVRGGETATDAAIAATWTIDSRRADGTPETISYQQQRFIRLQGLANPQLVASLLKQRCQAQRS